MLHVQLESILLPNGAQSRACGQTAGERQAALVANYCRGWSLDVAQVLHLTPVALLGHFALVLFALQVLPELHLLAGTRVAHGAVELATGSHTHGQVTGDPLARAGVEVGTWGGDRKGWLAWRKSGLGAAQ